jgi:hypothetical protein
MILLGVLIVSAILAYWGMGAGLYAVFSRYLMVVLAVAAGVGFSGALRTSIASTNPYLYGPFLLTIAASVYLLERTLADFCFHEPELSLPLFVDRLGGAIVGFGIGMTALSYLALVFAAVPLPGSAQSLVPELRQIARVAVAAARVVGGIAGTGVPITLDGVLPP